MADVANADEARKCLDIAHAALQAGNADKAARFAEKAMKLYPHDEARKLLRIIKSKGGASTSGATANGSANGGSSTADSGPSLRRRPAPAAPGGQAQRQRPEAAREDRSTPEQRELVASILRKKDFYEVLGVARGCSEEDVKRAYKKLALKLHPDKNTAPRSDEAFKVVSKAFSCLSDAGKRAAYDRYGEEGPGTSGRGGGGGGPYGGGGGFEDIDPNEIFNMFFGGGFPSNRNAHIFRTFGGGFPHGGRQPQGDPPSLGTQLAQLLPILFMLLLTFFAMRPSEPVYSLDRMGDFARQLDTQRFHVPFFVKTGPDFERSYPENSHARARVEQEVEVGYKERLDRRCYQERLQQQRMFRWGQAAKAKQQPMPACQEIVDRFGSQYAYQQTVYGY